jgi:hypothetical protein
VEISYSHRFVFVHVYRVGGQSMRAALRPYCHVPEPPRLARVPGVRKLTGRRSIYALREHNHGHIRARELREALPPDVFDGFFKFAFVRNPWDWQLSIYHFVRQLTEHPDHAFFQTFQRFEDYLDWRVHTAGPELQSEFVTDESGELLVDFLGRYESLAEDFARVCERVGIDAPLPHRNASVHGDFRDYYTPATEALVREAYAEDVERFGYRFDRQNDARPG